MGCCLPGSCVHGIFQARILELVAISFSRGFSQPRNWTLYLASPAGRFFTTAPPILLIEHAPRHVAWDTILQDYPRIKQFSFKNVGKKSHQIPKVARGRKKKKRESVERKAKLRLFLWNRACLYLRKEVRKPMQSDPVKIVAGKAMIGESQSQKKGQGMNIECK